MSLISQLQLPSVYLSRGKAAFKGQSLHLIMSTKASAPLALVTASRYQAILKEETSLLVAHINNHTEPCQMESG